MSAHFEDGIAGYIHARAVVDVYFPIDMRGNADISCNQCQFFRRSSRTCALNDAVVQYPEKYVGGNCELDLVDEDE